MKACVSVCMQSIGLELSECKVVEGSEKNSVCLVLCYCTVLK